MKLTKNRNTHASEYYGISKKILEAFIALLCLFSLLSKSYLISHFGAHSNYRLRKVCITTIAHETKLTSNLFQLSRD